MKKLKNEILIKDWLALKPYKKHSPSDNYYLKLSNKVHHLIKASSHHSTLLEYFGNEYSILNMSCFLTSYFEDKISETNIWNTFINVYRKQYNKDLPFYRPEEYFEDEINTEDISLLIWYYISSLMDEVFFDPHTDLIIELSESIMDEVFDEAWEFAPENKLLKTFYTIDEKTTDFYECRKLLGKVLIDSYLFYIDTGKDLYEKEMRLMENRRELDPYKLMHYMNEEFDNQTNNARTRLMALRGKDWVAALLGENHPLAKSFGEMSEKIKGWFIIRGVYGDYIKLEHVFSGQEIDLWKDSFNEDSILEEKDPLVLIGMVKWQGKWWFSGTLMKESYNQKLVDEIKKTDTDLRQMAPLVFEKFDMKEQLEKQYQAFLLFNNGSPIAFMDERELEDFHRVFNKFNNDFIKKKLTKEQLSNKSKNPLWTPSKTLKGPSQPCVVFFNPKSGIEMCFGAECAFPSSENPFFNQEECHDDLMSLLTSPEFSMEIAEYCIENYSSKLPFLQTKRGKLVLEHLDFLLRFWKKNNYFTIPSVLPLEFIKNPLPAGFLKS